MIVPLRATLRARDGSVSHGYTPAFDPADGSLWLQPTPDSPAGSMIAIDRIEVLYLEARDGRPIAIPRSQSNLRGSGDELWCVQLQRGERLYARSISDVPGRGMWLDPVGRSLSRAFVPSSQVALVQESPTSPNLDVSDGWSFTNLAEPSLSIGADFAPTSAIEVVTERGRAVDTSERATVPPVRDDSTVAMEPISESMFGEVTQPDLEPFVPEE
jgi:hypothetical protein